MVDLNCGITKGQFDYLMLFIDIDKIPTISFQKFIALISLKRYSPSNIKEIKIL